MADDESINFVNAVNVYTRIPASLHKRLRLACAERGIKLPGAIAEAIERWVALSSHDQTIDSGRPEVLKNSPAELTGSTGIVECRIVPSVTVLLGAGRAREVERIADLVDAMAQEIHAHPLSEEEVIKRAKELGRRHLGDALAPMPTEDPARATGKAGKRTG